MYRIECLFLYIWQIFFQDLSSRPELKLPSISASPLIDPHVSPDGSMLAYIRNHDLHVLDILLNESKQITFGADGITSVSVNLQFGQMIGFFSCFYVWKFLILVAYHTFYGMPMLRKRRRLRIIDNHC